MAKDKAHRKYLLTLNHPVEHGFSHENIRTIIGQFSGCIYWCFCDEVGEQGTPHTHVYLVFRNAVLFSTIQRRFYGAHIDPAKGSSEENRNYVRKEGKWADDAKHDTNLIETFEESGPLPDERRQQQKDSEVILGMICDGASNADILEEFPTALSKLHHIDAARQVMLEKKYREQFRKLNVSYIWGETGVGKTRGVMEKYGYAQVYRVTNYAHPFDGYKGEAVILFDEFRSSLPISDMLKYLDGYPVMLPCRYADKVACFDTVYVISNIPLEEQYPNIQMDEPETWKALLRRFDSVTEKLRWERGDGLPF